MLREVCQRNSKDNMTGNGTYSTEGPIHQVTVMTKKPSSAPGLRFKDLGLMN